MAMVAFLLDQGAEVNATDHFGRTPLRWAADEGFHGIAQVLLSRSAEILVKSAHEGGYTALHWAATRGRGVITDMFLDSDPAVHFRSAGDDFQEIHLAAAKNHSKEMAELLKERLKIKPLEY